MSTKNSGEINFSAEKAMQNVLKQLGVIDEAADKLTKKERELDINVNATATKKQLKDLISDVKSTYTEMAKIYKNFEKTTSEKQKKKYSNQLETMNGRLLAQGKGSISQNDVIKGMISALKELGVEADKTKDILSTITSAQNRKAKSGNLTDYIKELREVGVASKDGSEQVSQSMEKQSSAARKAREEVEKLSQAKKELNTTSTPSKESGVSSDISNQSEEERALALQEKRLQLQKDHIRLVKEASDLESAYTKLESEQGYDIRSQETSQANVRLLEKLIELRKNENALREEGVEFDSRLREIAGMREDSLDDELRLAQGVLQDWIDVNNQIKSVRDNQKDLAYYMEEVVRLRSNVRTENWFDDADKKDTIEALQLAEKSLQENIKFYQYMSNKTPVSSENIPVQEMEKFEQVSKDTVSVVSDVGKSEDEILEKIRQERLEAEKNNEVLREHLILLDKAGKVVANHWGSTNNVSGSFTSEQLAEAEGGKLLHVHPGKASFFGGKDMTHLFQDAMYEKIKQVELLWSDSVLSVDKSSMTKQSASTILNIMRNVRTTLTKMYTDNPGGTPSRDAREHINAIEKEIFKAVTQKLNISVSETGEQATQVTSALSDIDKAIIQKFREVESKVVQDINPSEIIASAKKTKERTLSSDKSVADSVDNSIPGLKDEGNVLDNILPSDKRFNDVLKKLDLTKSELVDIVKITKQSVSDADGKFHDSYTLKDSRGSTEIYGVNSKTDKGQILRQNIVGYDKKKDELDISKAQLEVDKQLAKEEDNLAKAQQKKAQAFLKEQANYEEDQKKAEFIKKQTAVYEELTNTISRYSEVAKRVAGGNAEDGDLELMTKLEDKISQLQKQPILSDSQVAKSEKSLVSLYDQLDKIERKLVKTNQESQDKLINGYDKRLESYTNKTSGYDATIKKFNDGGWSSPEYLQNVQAVKNAVKQYEDLLSDIKAKGGIASEKDIQTLNEYENTIKKTIATVSNMSASEKGYNFVSGQKELDKIHKLLAENSKMSSEARAKIKAFYREIESGNPSMSLDKIHGEIMKIVNAETEAGRAGRTFFDTLKNSGFHQIAAQMAGMFGVYDIINLGKEGFNVVRELNTALTEMRKVSNETVQSLKNYQATTFDTADAVGTTAKQIQNSTADWMRLGESMDQAAESAKDANVLLNVSEFEGIDEATESLVSMSQAYKDLDKMDIIDVLNNIGNNYSISTDGLATALKDSASALVTANNDLNEAVSLTTAGNAITQDPSKVGAGLRTISLRLVGTEEAKQELSDLGEETDGMITTVSKLRDTIMDATKAASSDGKGFDILDSNGNYKSTYEIMQGLADLYDDIVKKDKELGTNNLNLLLETIAGKNRSNIAASILQNGDMLRSVYKDAQNSEGSAEQELNSYLDSIDGKMAQLENRAQEFWFKVIDSETIKNGIDLLTSLVKGATDFVDTVGLLPTILTGISAALSFKNVGGSKMYDLICFE